MKAKMQVQFRNGLKYANCAIFRQFYIKRRQEVVPTLKNRISCTVLQLLLYYYSYLSKIAMIVSVVSFWGEIHDVTYFVYC